MTEHDLFTVIAEDKNGSSGQGFTTVEELGTTLDQVWDNVKDDFWPGTRVSITNLWSRTTKTFIKE